MLSDEVLERIVERLAIRIEDANTYTLKKIAKSIKKIGQAKTSDLRELEQILKYGGDYDKIIRRLAKMTELNVKDIKDIFREVAKKDYEFAEKFYKYRNIKYIPFDENVALKNQVDALANITASEYINLSNTSAIGFSIKDLRGRTIFQNLGDTYRNVIDEAVLSVSQGKSTFDEQMYKIIKELGSSGLKTVNYATGRSIRLDSAIRMNMRGALRSLHNEMQEQFGEDFGYNGIEVSHHVNSAPDHIDTVDGKQFVLVDKVQEQINNGIETEIKQEDIRGNQVKVKGKTYDDFNAVNNSLDRPVSTLNCRHYTFSIIVGVSKPEYTQEQLDEDKKKNLDGFEFEGKHYSLYDGEQLLQKVELELRKSKDTQIIARSSNNTELVGEMQSRITQLTSKYRDILKVSGLKSKLERARVPQYRRINVKNMK